MILRERVGGGGSEKFGFSVAGRIACGLEVRPLLLAGAMAGGGSVNDVSRAELGAGSLPCMSSDEAGVGGKLVRGMLEDELSCTTFNWPQPRTQQSRTDISKRMG